MKRGLKFTLAAAMLPTALGIGCNSVPTRDPYAPAPDPYRPAEIVNSPFKMQKIAHGRFFNLNASESDGMHRLTIAADKAGTPNELNCIIITQAVGSPTGVAAMSCDYDAARAPRTTTPAP